MSKKRQEAEINSSSLADIAFLLLMFFLVTTTINVDKGIGLTLPPVETNPADVHKRNMLVVLVNEQGATQLNGDITQLDEIQTKVVEFVDNKGLQPELSESPLSAVVVLKTQRGTPYKVYIDVLDEIKSGYASLRNKASMSKFGKAYAELEEGSDSQNYIRNLYPLKISLGEPEDE